MATLIKTKGIVLHEMSIKEQDKRILLFSVDYGKMVVFANGAKRSKSSLLAGTQPFVFGEFYLYEGQNTYTLKQVDIVESFYTLREDLPSLYYGLYLLEVCNHVVQEMDSNADLLRLLYMSLIALKKQMQDPEVIRRIFEFRGLSTLGLTPDLDQDFFEMSQDTRDILLYLQQVKMERIYAFKIEKHCFYQIRQVIDGYFRHYVGGHYKSLEFIESLQEGS